MATSEPALFALSLFLELALPHAKTSTKSHATPHAKSAPQATASAEVLTLHLVRHAPTQPNAERRYPQQGEDAPLSGESVEVAAALASRLPNPAQVVALSSPSARTLQTAQHAGFAPQTAAALAEADFGVMAGKTWAELEQTYADLPWHWTKALSDPTLNFGPPQGETGKEFHARLQQWLQGLPAAGEVVAFTHAGPIHAILRLTVGLSAVETPPCTVVTLKRSGGSWWLTGLHRPQGV